MITLLSDSRQTTRHDVVSLIFLCQESSIEKVVAINVKELVLNFARAQRYVDRSLATNSTQCNMPPLLAIALPSSPHNL